jgi:phage terminase small subunit
MQPESQELPEDESLEPLEPREEQYCHEYLLDLNQTQAAIRAGYAESNARAQASRLMTKANILARIAELKAARVERVQITSDWVLRRLVEISDKCMEPEPVMVFSPADKRMVQKENAEGQKLFEFNAAGANKATELIGKHLGFFEEHNKQKAPVGVDYSKLSKATLADILNATNPNA